MLKKLKIFFWVAFITMTLTTNIFAEGNLIKNGSFEDEQEGTPIGWTIYSYVKDEGSAEFKIETDGAYSGSKCVTIVNNVENDSRYIQTVSSQPNKNYKLSCYVKAENIGESGNGAILSVEGQVAASHSLRNTDGMWEYTEMYVKTGEGINSFNVTVGVGGYGAMSTGKASFDEITAEEVDTIPAGATVAILDPVEADTSSSGTTSEAGKKPGTNKTVWIVLAVCILIVAAATYSTFKSPSEKNNDSDNSSDLTNSNSELPQDSVETKAQNDGKIVNSDDLNDSDLEDR